MGEKFYYAAGPGDVVGTFLHWQEGRDDPSQFAVTYSKQFFDFVAKRDGEALIVSANGRQDEVSAKGMVVKNRPVPAYASKGKIGYWVGQLWNGLLLMRDLVHYRPKCAVIAEGTAPWIFTMPAIWLGVEVIPALHCVLWPLYGAPNSILSKADSFVFRKGIRQFLCASEEIADQVRVLAGEDADCRLFLPTYRADQFEQFVPVDWSEGPYRILYLGRMEEDKGVFDLFDALLALDVTSGLDFILEFCGEGSARERLEYRIAEAGLKDRVLLHGHCQKEDLHRHISESHLICVPTTSSFVEGFNQVVAEGVLAGRQVVATSVCPAARIFGNAVTIVRPDSPADLSEAIRSVAERMTQPGAEKENLDTGASAKLLTEEESWEMELNRCIEESSQNQQGIGYLVPQFPSQTHAFFWRELSAMREKGADIQLLSTRPPFGEPCHHDFAEPASKETVYLSSVSMAAVLRVLSRPFSLLKSVRYIFSLSETPMAKRLRALSFIPCAAQLSIVAEKKGIGHVHLHSCADAGHIGALARFFGGPNYSLTLHGDLTVYGTDHVRKFADAEWVSAVTRPLQQQIVDNAGLARGKVPVIWMGVDVEQFTPVNRRDRKEGPLHLVTVARIIPQKGHLHALEAIARVRDAGHKVRYSIAGSGPFETVVKEKIEELGLTDEVTMLGSIAETAVRKLLDEADVFMLPSYGLGEAAPVCVMEGMACGLPVICSRIGGTEDMINHLKDGWLVHQHNEDEITEAISRFASDPEFRFTIGEAARETALQHFDHRKNAGQLLDCIRGDESAIERASNAADVALAR